MPINESTREFTFEKNKDTIYNQSPKSFTFGTKRWAKAKKTQALGRQEVYSMKTFNNGTLLSSVFKKNWTAF